MSLSRREALARLSVLAASVVAGRGGLVAASDPVEGTIADYATGLRSRRWTAAETTARALERCRTEGAALRAIDALSTTAITDAKAADRRRRNRTLRGPLDGED